MSPTDSSTIGAMRNRTRGSTRIHTAITTVITVRNCTNTIAATSITLALCDGEDDISPRGSTIGNGRGG